MRRRVRTRHLRTTLAVVLAAATAGVATVFVGAGSEAAPDNPVLVAKPQPTTTVPTPTTTLALPLPQPEAPPANPRERVPVVAIGRIEIPKIGLTHTVYEGVALTVVDVGPGHWPGTAMPGEVGNTVFAGHRVTRSHPFRRVDELVGGDSIVLHTDAGAFTYRVTSIEVVRPDALWIVDQTPASTITLFACHPPGSAAYRIVVHGVLAANSPA